MDERLYTSHADCYDALYRETKEYDTEVEFVVEQFDATGQTDNERVLIVGCGTGEHARRLDARGFDVHGVDKYEAMIAIARVKSKATFQVGAVPDVDLDGTFDLILMPFTVINHLAPDDLDPTLQTLADALVEGGVLIFDNGAFPTADEEPPQPGLAVHATDAGDIARLTQVRPRSDRRVRWNSVVFVQDRGEFFVDTHDLTVFDDSEIIGLLQDLGFDVDTYDGYGTDGSGTVFVAS